MNGSVEEYISRSEEDTLRIARSFAQRLKPGDIIAFYGELGAGKTEVIKGICQYFHVEELVTSPTFTIINQYFGNFPGGQEVVLYHVDLYRVKSARELQDIGFGECVTAPDAIKMVEWSEHADHLLLLPHYSVSIDFAPDSETSRIIRIGHVQPTEAY
ncbi:MAG: tRNA (adenosine(37)-N6)-threonylcarbamoyltransferase complex ATPase subunit type 1 TsaE [Candidatus Kapabacteria bacterium]|nr:tRNA (adenosine(37)-N6)-threonylcarbamoyltransferase complex ATPase subunit type 1 TsaE [Candidatus Kapabacteria bacterium]MDW8225199.1 tRNA (adenosine(37)-N6)-threonylcarbamoyltransferase complex ATPase subunit type 1 TsaE [Bacteroidota bacterium]